MCVRPCERTPCYLAAARPHARKLILFHSSAATLCISPLTHMSRHTEENLCRNEPSFFHRVKENVVIMMFTWSCNQHICLIWVPNLIITGLCCSCFLFHYYKFIVWGFLQVIGVCGEISKVSVFHPLLHIAFNCPVSMSNLIS